MSNMQEYSKMIAEYLNGKKVSNCTINAMTKGDSGIELKVNINTKDTVRMLNSAFIAGYIIGMNVRSGTVNFSTVLNNGYPVIEAMVWLDRINIIRDTEYLNEENNNQIDDFVVGT